MNPLGMVVALLGAMDHAAAISKINVDRVTQFTSNCRDAMYQAFRDGRGTRDMAGPSGLTTEGFVETVAQDLKKMQKGEALQPRPVKPATATRKPSKHTFRANVDKEALTALFGRYDVNGDGSIDYKEFLDMTMHLGIAPLKGK